MKLEVTLPNTKISESFLEFAEPYLVKEGEPPTKAEVEKVLRMPWTVWNAVVMDTVNGNTHYVSQIRKLTGDDPQIAALTEGMILRKKDLFGHDLRMVGNYEIFIEKDGEWRLRAEARLGGAKGNLDPAQKDKK